MNTTKVLAATLTVTLALLVIFALAGVDWAAIALSVIAALELVALIVTTRGGRHA